MANAANVTRQDPLEVQTVGGHYFWGTVPFFFGVCYIFIM